MKQTYSPEQQYLVQTITRLGCMSVTQASFMLYKNFGIHQNQAEYIIHTLEYDYIIHSDKDFKWIAYGREGMKNAHTLNADSIRAISVALAVIEDPEDYATMYRPYNATDLRFYTEGTSFEVIMSSVEHINKLMYFKKMYESQFAEMQKKVGEDMTYDILSKYLITFPAQENKKLANKYIEKMGLTFPYSVIFLTEKDIFARNHIEVYEP